MYFVQRLTVLFSQNAELTKAGVKLIGEICGGAGISGMLSLVTVPILYNYTEG